MMDTQIVSTEIKISDNLLNLIHSRKQLNIMLDATSREAAVSLWFPAVDSQSTQQILLNNLQLKRVNIRENDNDNNHTNDGNDNITEDIDKIKEKRKKIENELIFIHSISQLHALVYENMKSNTNSTTTSTISSSDINSTAASAQSNCMLLLKPNQIKYTYNSSSSSFPTAEEARNRILAGSLLISVHSLEGYNFRCDFKLLSIYSLVIFLSLSVSLFLSLRTMNIASSCYAPSYCNVIVTFYLLGFSFNFLRSILFTVIISYLFGSIIINYC